MQQSSPASIHNRFSAVMVHTTRYSIRGQARLARDVGVARSTISRLFSGQAQPSFSLVMQITACFERELGRPIHPNELISLSGSYPTASVCALCGCPGCLPPHAYGRDDRIKPEYQHIQPGRWSADGAAEPCLIALPDSS